MVPISSSWQWVISSHWVWMRSATCLLTKRWNDTHRLHYIINTTAPFWRKFSSLSALKKLQCYVLTYEEDTEQGTPKSAGIMASSIQQQPANNRLLPTILWVWKTTPSNWKENQLHRAVPWPLHMHMCLPSTCAHTHVTRILTDFNNKNSEPGGSGTHL